MLAKASILLALLAVSATASRDLMQGE